jgi:hypothetical protein
VVDTARSKTALDNLETAALTENHVRDGDADVVENDVAVAVRSVIVTIDVQHAFHGDTREAGGYEDHGLLAVGVLVVGVGLAHDKINLAAGVTGAG